MNFLQGQILNNRLKYCIPDDRTSCQGKSQIEVHFFHMDSLLLMRHSNNCLTLINFGLIHFNSHNRREDS